MTADAPGEIWDWAAQKRDTDFTYKELMKESGLEPGTLITLDLQFLPSETDFDEDALVKALESFGYEVSVYAEEEDADEGLFTVEASVAGVPFTVDDIWKHEERTTKIALARGYAPDGWGFWDPNEAGDEETDATDD